MSGPSDAVKRAARRAIDEPFFLAGALHIYQDENGMDDAQLAEFLGCPPDDLSRLALCRRPAAESFVGDVGRLATRFHLRGSRLAALLRELEVLDELRYGGSAAMAARDREEDGPTILPDGERP